MKKILICLVMALSIFVALSGCKKAVDPTVPAATLTPNASQTIQALVSAVGAANATATMAAVQSQTAAALLFTATGTPTNTSTPDYASFVPVPGGTFFQAIGNSSGFSHTVSAFKLGRYEVTYDLWYTVYQWAISNGFIFSNAGREGDAGITGAAPSAAKNEPVTTINWRDAIVWANAYSQKSGFAPVYYTDPGFTTALMDSTDGAYGGSVNSTAGSFDNPYVNWAANGYRLPSEGEWQYAASYIDGSNWTPYNRASGAAEDYYDSTETERVAWFFYNSGFVAHNTGGRAANGLGIYDMSGNVYEWCWDWYDVYPGPSVDYRGTASGSLPYRIIRGGSYVNDPNYMQVSMRLFSGPNSENSYMGLRLARSN